MDMAKERGESVAFTAAYAGNLEMLADLTEHLLKERNLKLVEVAKEMEVLLQMMRLFMRAWSKRQSFFPDIVLPVNMIFPDRRHICLQNRWLRALEARRSG